MRSTQYFSAISDNSLRNAVYIQRNNFGTFVSRAYLISDVCERQEILHVGGHSHPANSARKEARRSSRIVVRFQPKL
jgi:hypothetical protein